MTPADVVEVLDRVAAAGIEVWIEGGWGIDALLGEQTRVHDDLDFGIAIDDVERLCAAFPEFARDDRDWPSALVLRDAAGRKLDAHPLTFDDRGDGWQARLDGDLDRWPGADLHARGTIGGREVTCITPELQLRWHLYDGFDDVDWRDVRLLCERFALAAPEQHRERPGFVAPKRGALN